jgi:hypothetical protein
MPDQINTAEKMTIQVVFGAVMLVMRRPLILLGIRVALTDRTDSLDEGGAQLLELHQFGLLLGHNLIELVHHLFLVRQFDFDVDESFFAHDHPLQKSIARWGSLLQ